VIGPGESGGDDYAVHLNLVPLIDILTNILFFLLLGFATQEIKYEGDLKLPTAGANAEFLMTLSITVSRGELRVGETAVARIRDNRIDTAMDGEKIVALYEKLNAIRAERIEATGGVSKEDDVVFLFADREAPYTLLSPVMKTAAMAGYPNFRLAVIKQ